MEFYFKKPEEVPPDLMEEIFALIKASGEVGVSWIKDNLRNAFLIGYVMDNGKLIGTMTLKRPLEKYVRKLEQKTGLSLEGYLERGYSAILDEYRGKGIGDKLLKGLVARAPGEKIYVTIRTDNEAAIGLTKKNKMRLAGKYVNQRTGHEIGIFVNS